MGALKAALPPTDARLRPDLRAWEQGNFELATEEKDRLEGNQVKRREKLKQILKNKGSEPNMNNEPSYYEPRFFEKKIISNEDGKDQPFYTLRGDEYWRRRFDQEGEKWSGVPRIYEDDCEVFY